MRCEYSERGLDERKRKRPMDRAAGEGWETRQEGRRLREQVHVVSSLHLHLHHTGYRGASLGPRRTHTRARDT